MAPPAAHGSGADGAHGVSLAEAGGTLLAEDGTTSDPFGMPEAAIRTAIADRTPPLDPTAGVPANLVQTAAA